MATIDVKDAAGATQTLERPLAPGRAAAATSRPVVLSTEDNATVGGLTETAPATDTASSGLNGRLQRIAQRLTSTIALLPAALGTGGGLKIDGSGTALPVSGTVALSGTSPVSGTVALSGTSSVSGTVTANAGTGNFAITAASGAIASGAIASGAFASGSIAAGAIAAGAASIADNEDVASADGDRGVKVLAVRKASPANTSGTDGDYEFLQISAGRLWTTTNVQFAGTAADLGSGTGGTATQRVIVDSTQLAALGQAAMAASQPVAIASNQTWPTGMSPRGLSATFTTLTRPANTTAYTAADSISDNATAGSVTALTATVSDTNDDPITLTEILISSTDTGLAGKKLRAYVFNSNPTSSSGVGAGDNAAYLQKKAGYIGSFMGWMETGFSDGSVGRLIPSFNETNFSNAGGFIVSLPVSGAKTLFIQFQAVEAFTPSANSTTIIATVRGFQGRAA